MSWNMENVETNYHIAKCYECDKELCGMRGKSQRGMAFEGKNRCELVIKHEQEQINKENISILQRVQFVFVNNKIIDDINEIDVNKLDKIVEIQKAVILETSYNRVTDYKSLKEEMNDLKKLSRKKYTDDDVVEFGYVALKLKDI